ncbi:MAG: metal-dependent hydrolase [Candidatus Nanohaloarchaea archaeon]
MGDFSEHVLFGLLAAAVSGYLLKGLVSPGFFEALSGLLLLFAGSVLPDIDHENSYVHRSIKAFLSISGAAAVMTFTPLMIHRRFAVAVIVMAATYAAVSVLRPRHRGFTHSWRFAFYSSSLVVSATVLVSGSLVPGAGFTLGVFSHLLLDGELP